MEAAQEAGAQIRASIASRDKTGVTVTVKSGIDLVTEVDQKCEKLVLEKLRREFPSHNFVGEESTFETEGADAASRVRQIIVEFPQPLFSVQLSLQRF